jgi:hypothetical protein
MHTFGLDDTVLDKQFQPQLDVSKADEYPLGLDEASHLVLLEYLKHRLDKGNRGRPSILARFASIDKYVSTWQKLSQADSQRKEKQEATGIAQAINVNLPLTHTHIEDMVSFFAGVYSPTQGDFFSVPDPALQDQARELIDKLNSDAKASKYFKNLCHVLRALLKYNVGGFAVSFGDAEDDNTVDGGVNKMDAIDMYNFLHDPAITDPADIPQKAEWAARMFLRNRFYCSLKDGDGWIGLDPILNGDSNGSVAKWYRHPPTSAGLSAVDDTTAIQGPQGNMDWSKYGASLSNEMTLPIDGYEHVEMYCWINPRDFGLKEAGVTFVDGLYLYRFDILAGSRIVGGELISVDGPATGLAGRPDIPYYLGFLNQDDMQGSQRSTGELLSPFQNYASFLMNADITGTRSSIFGLQGYDPNMFDLSKLPEGATTGRIPSQAPGRDVRSGLMNVQSQYDTGATMQKLGLLMNLVREFYPSQALPNQIASMDRAVTSQVAAVLQGVSRRLHMLVRILDDDVMSPARFKAYKNIAANKAAVIGGLDDAKVRKILGSGLQQLNREAAAQSAKELLFAILQNPQSAQGFDVLSFIQFWGGLMNMSVDLRAFTKAPAPQDPNQPNANAGVVAPNGVATTASPAGSAG